VIRLAFLGRDQFTIEETWDTVGMRGTGSHHISASAIQLPRERSATLWDAMWPDDALFRLRPFDVLGPSLGAVPLGIGRAALDGALLDRQRRDIETARTHVMFSPRIAAGMARQLAGIDTVVFPFLPI
jgi:alkylation response protein AidB-like acyl-CoA dehydrogenase